MVGLGERVSSSSVYRRASVACEGVRGESVRGGGGGECEG